jgi:hypothetical protein
MFCITVIGPDSTEHPGIEAACIGCSLSLLERKTEGVRCKIEASGWQHNSQCLSFHLYKQTLHGKVLSFSFCLL